jgi:hypothetical protein
MGSHPDYTLPHMIDPNLPLPLYIWDCLNKSSGGIANAVFFDFLPKVIWESEIVHSARDTVHTTTEYLSFYQQQLYQKIYEISIDSMRCAHPVYGPMCVDFVAEVTSIVASSLPGYVAGSLFGEVVIAYLTYRVLSEFHTYYYSPEFDWNQVGMKIAEIVTKVGASYAVSKTGAKFAGSKMAQQHMTPENIERLTRAARGFVNGLNSANPKDWDPKVIFASMATNVVGGEAAQKTSAAKEAFKKDHAWANNADNIFNPFSALRQRWLRRQEFTQREKETKMRNTKMKQQSTRTALKKGLNNDDVDPPMPDPPKPDKPPDSGPPSTGGSTGANSQPPNPCKNDVQHVDHQLAKDRVASNDRRPDIKFTRPLDANKEYLRKHKLYPNEYKLHSIPGANINQFWTKEEAAAESFKRSYEPNRTGLGGRVEGGLRSSWGTCGGANIQDHHVRDANIFNIGGKFDIGSGFW